MDTAEALRIAPRAAFAGIALLGLTAFVAIVDGLGLRAAALAALLVLPIALYIAFEWPLESVFGLYVLLVPFDNLLGTGSFGTVTKFLGIAAGAFLTLSLARRRAFTFESKPLRILCLFALWMTASTLWSIDQGSSLKILPTYLGLFVLYAAVTMVPITTAQFRTLLLLALLGGICAAAYGAHSFYQNPPQPDGGPIQRLVLQVGNSSIDPNHFANALILPACIAVMWALRAKLAAVRIACIAATALIVAAVLLSGSREGLIAMAFIAAYYAWRSRYRLRLMVAVGAVVLVAATVETSVFARFSSALQTGGSGRTSIWAVALEAAKHRLLQGYGIGSFPAAYDQFYLRVPQPYPYGWDSPAHNLILHYLVETGLVGLFLIAAFLWMQFRSLRDVNPRGDLQDERIMMEAALIAIGIVSTTIDLFHYKYAWLVFFMVALLRNAARNDQEQEAIRRTTPAMTSARSLAASTRALPRSPNSRSALLSSSER